MYCGKCGREIPANARFCDRCGAPVPPVWAPVPQQAQYWQYGPAYGRQTPAPTVFPQLERNRRRSRWMVPLAVVLAVLVTCIFILSAAILAVRVERGSRYGKGDTSTVDFDLAFDIRSAGRSTEVSANMATPVTIPRRQEVARLVVSPEPMEYAEMDGNRFAKFYWGAIAGTVTLRMTGRATISRYDLETARENPQPGTASDLSAYLIDEECIEKDSPEITAAAARIGGPGRVETVHEIFDYVVDNLRYVYMDEEQGALDALIEGEGDCQEYSDLFIALCRARGIPARNVYGFLVTDEVEEVGHAWAEVYFDQYGWVPFDPTNADDGPATFESMPPIYFESSSSRERLHFVESAGDDIFIDQAFRFTPADPDGLESGPVVPAPLSPVSPQPPAILELTGYLECQSAHPPMVLVPAPLLS